MSNQQDGRSNGGQHKQPQQYLPSRRSVEQAIKVIEDFRAVCRHQMDFGYWATVDFPSKHHINKLLQMGYRKKEELLEVYGDGLTRHVYELLPACKAYVGFIRELEQPRQQKQSEQK